MESKQSAETSEETKAYSSSKKQGMKAEEFKKQVYDIKSLLKTLSVLKEQKIKHGNKEVLTECYKMLEFSLSQMLNVNQYSVEFERLLNRNEIVTRIKSWLGQLKCSHDGCPHNATITYLNESTYNIYCEAHANVDDHSTDQLKFKFELSDNKSAMKELEKKLVLTQKQLAGFRSENINDISSVGKLKILDDKYENLKAIIKSMKERLEGIIGKNDQI